MLHGLAKSILFAPLLPCFFVGLVSSEDYESEEAVQSTSSYQNTNAGSIQNDDNGGANGGGSVRDGQSKTFIVNGVSFKMIAVKGGSFDMGSDDSDDWAAPGRYVMILVDHYIGETEVTQELWQAVMGNNPSCFTGDLQRPVECVSWDDCQTFIGKLNNLTGEKFGLPDERLWEYAARGGNKSKGYVYSGSNNIDDVAWYEDNSNATTHTVKTKAPNELGIYDMSGNVREWCSDRYEDWAKTCIDWETDQDDTVAVTDSNRVIRGGSMNCRAAACRVAHRRFFTPTGIDSNLGLRLAITIYK